MIVTEVILNDRIGHLGREGGREGGREVREGREGEDREEGREGGGRERER